MPREIVMDVTTGIIVLGSIFGASHIKKLVAFLRKRKEEREFGKASAPVAQFRTDPGQRA